LSRWKTGDGGTGGGAGRDTRDAKRLRSTGRGCAHGTRHGGRGTTPRVRFAVGSGARSVSRGSENRAAHCPGRLCGHQRTTANVGACPATADNEPSPEHGTRSGRCPLRRKTEGISSRHRRHRPRDSLQRRRTLPFPRQGTHPCATWRLGILPMTTVKPRGAAALLTTPCTAFNRRGYATERGAL